MRLESPPIMGIWLGWFGVAVNFFALVLVPVRYENGNGFMVSFGKENDV